MKKRILTVALGLVIAMFAFTGCSDGIKATVSGEETPFGKYDQTLELSTIKYLDPVVASNINKLSGITGETLQDNRWTREFKERLNIAVKYVLDGSGESFNTSWSGIMASGDLPDFFPVGLSDYSDLVKGGQIWDMTELYEKYASPILKSIMAEAGDSIKNAITIDGKIYGIPQPVSQYDSYRYLYIRRDWMAKVGVTKAPATPEELIELMGKFINAKLGGKTTYAFPLAQDMWFNLEGFFAMYGAYPDSWIIKDGALKLGAVDDSMIEPLAAVNKMFNDGWLDPTFVTTSYEQSKTMVAAGQTGVLMGAHYNATDFILPSINADPSADWAVFEWPVKSGKTFNHQLQLGMNDIVVASKKSGNPEALIKMMNVYFENLYGETGDYDKWGNEQVDQIWAIGPFFSYRPQVNAIPYRDIQKVLKGEAQASELKGLSKNYYKKAITDKAKDWNLMFGEIPTSKTFNINGESITVNGGNTAGYYLDKVVSGEIKTFVNPFAAPPTPTIKDSGTDLGTLSEIYFAAAISGKKNTTTDFASFCSSWYKGGGTQIEKEVNDWYKSVNK